MLRVFSTFVGLGLLLVITAVGVGVYRYQSASQREIAEASYKFQQAVERREKIIVGVNDFVQDDEPPVPILYIDDTTAGIQLERLDRLRKSRNNDAVNRSLDGLRHAARGQGNTMEALLDCVRAYATVGEMCDALRDVWGEYQEVPLV